MLDTGIGRAASLVLSWPVTLSVTSPSVVGLATPDTAFSLQQP